MKKYILFLIVFSFIFNFNVNQSSAITASNSSYDYGSDCLAGDNFSRTTGKPCSAKPAKPECKAGDLFSSVTGKPCDKTSIVPTPFPGCGRAFDPKLKMGSRGAEVMVLQQSLKEEGLYAGKIDGVYGPITEGAKSSYYRKCPIENSVPTIKILSPNGGETWATGTTQKIKWSSSSDISSVTIVIERLYDCNTSSGGVCAALYSTEVARVEDLKNKNYYDWAIPKDFISGRYSVTVSDAGDASQSDSSDSYFNIGIRTTQ